jgi:sensor histidine kinase YesM
MDDSVLKGGTNMKKLVAALFVSLISGSLTVALADHMSKTGTHKPEKMVQGILKDVDPLNHTITMDLGVREDQEIKESQLVNLKVSDEAFEQIHRSGKTGQRLELRLSGDDVVEAIAVGMGP